MQETVNQKIRMVHEKKRSLEFLPFSWNDGLLLYLAMKSDHIADVNKMVKRGE